jgi:hypothetical protein
LKTVASPVGWRIGEGRAAANPFASNQVFAMGFENLGISGQGVAPSFVLVTWAEKQCRHAIDTVIYQFLYACTPKRLA